MLIGFVLLVSPCLTCTAQTVTEDIYPTQSECQQVSTLINERRTDAVLMCSEVYRQ